MTGHDVNIEKCYSSREVVAELRRRLADALEEEEAYEIQISGRNFPKNWIGHIPYRR